MKRKLITFDWAIKRLLRSKANFGILEGFLNEKQKQLFKRDSVESLYPEYYLIKINLPPRNTQ